MAGSFRVDFLVNAAAGNGTAFEFIGGKMAFMAEATWGGGNVKLQFQSPHATWIDVANSTLSANGMLTLDLPRGQYRAVATTSTANYVYGVSVPSMR